jgi:hypothetical protein
MKLAGGAESRFEKISSRLAVKLVASDGRREW